MRIHPDMRNTIRPNRSIAHLLRHARPAIRIRARIDPADNLFCNQGAIGPRSQLHLDYCRMPVQRQPFLIAAEYNFHRTIRLTRKAGRNRFSAHKRLCAKSAAHRWRNNPNLAFGNGKDASQVHTQVKGSLRTSPDFETIIYPTRYRSMWLHRHVLRARRSIGFLNHYLRLLKALVYLTMPDTKTMADIGAFLRSYAEVGRVVVRNGMMFVYKRRALCYCLDS